jgi:hypothetical protein
MADVASSLKNWSSVPASNSPTSATTIGTGLAPNFQQIQATLRNELATRSASVTAAATTDIGVKDEGTVLVTNAAGTVAISSFGTVSAGIKKLVTFVVSGGSLSLTHNATSLILPGSANISVTTGASLLAESLGSGNWKIHWYANQDGSSVLGVTPAQLQAQTYTTFTTGGTSAAYTLTPTPALTALATGQRFNVTFNATAGPTPTLAISGLAAKSIKYYDTTGAKQSVTSTQLVANLNTDVIYDGTDYVLLNPTGNGATFATNAEYVTGTETAKAISPAVARARNLVAGTVIPTTSGTSHDVTGLPSWVKRITIELAGVSTNGTSSLMLQIGDSGGIENTGYVGVSGGANTGNALTVLSFTTGFGLTSILAATNALSGNLILTLQDPATNTWTASGSFGNVVTTVGVFNTAGHKALSATLDRIRLTTVSGTDVFDAGSINIIYE